MSNDSDPSLPMPEPTVPRRPFPTFKLLSFDIYGTLIDWEQGILERLKPLISRLDGATNAPAHAQQYLEDSRSNPTGRPVQLAAKFNEIEAQLQAENPGAKYSEILRKAYLRLAEDLGVTDTNIDQEAQAFGASIGEWPAFSDTVNAMRRLRKYYDFLVPLSNVDRDSFAGTRTGPLQNKVDFFRVYTAQDIGSYKPNPRNFDYLIDHVKLDAGVDKHDILHVAQSLFHDHVPAKRAGLSSVWINRAGAGMGSGKGIKTLHDAGEVGYGWRYATLGEFADEVERQFAEQQQGKGQ
ncbi:hypothetical protein ABEF92_006897 [Exophiala dermatitidis]|uniref:Haloalkanoic acid dehalogenase n=1 Tax=Exophiala dermatitidis (strain ATCC 34100 / CBS 525.76 / NIH/UT8656) TaxID=858893 RepID=H6C087_EXODN|nr:haloalkanoic acid dehalogenase [Exophiala dermatitidis NIH/UT8656]EHY56369.1 haloalkanoic acid dehalogenase [Exophiala dermatitidis NIH/UT8656]